MGAAQIMAGMASPRLRGGTGATMRPSRIPIIVAALAIGLGSACSTPPPADPAEAPVAYRLSPVLADGALTHLGVEMRFLGDADGESVIELPDRWAGEAELWRLVEDLEIGPPGRLRPFAVGGARVVVAHAPSAALVARYHVNSGYDRDPDTGGRGNPHRPIVRPSWFSAIGHTLFAYPEGRRSAPAVFEFDGLPRGWTAVSDAEHGRMGRPLAVGDVLQSTNVGGAGLRVHERAIRGGRLRIAMLGSWESLDPERFGALLTRVIDAQREFWNDTEQPFLVTLTPVRVGGGPLMRVSHRGGTGLGDAYALYASDNQSEEELRAVIAHEHLHSWIPRRLGGAYATDEPRGYWLSEGLTDFYTHRTLLRSGVWTLEEFAAALNQTLADYAASPVRDAPNGRVVEAFWNDPFVRKLPYQRGALLAAIWDHRLREATGGRIDLDDVMLAMRDRAIATAARRGERVPAPDLLPVVIQELSGLDTRPDLARYIEAGDTIVLPESLYGDCATVSSGPAMVFDTGFDRDAARRSGVISGVSPGSAAYAASLRNGMRFRMAAGREGDPSQDWTVQVAEPDGLRTFRYKPAKPGEGQVQRIVLTSNMSPGTRAACARSMSGD